MTKVDDIIHSLDLFKSLSKEQCHKILGVAELVRVDAGHVLFREGDVGDSVFIVVEGRIRITKNVSGFGEELLATLESGSYFGEMAFFDDETRSADALAAGPGSLLRIGKDKLEALLLSDKDLAHELLWNFIHTLSRRLRETNERLRSYFAFSGGGNFK